MKQLIKYLKVFEILLTNGKKAAVKEINLQAFSKEKCTKDYKKVEKEINILKSIEHDNIVKYENFNILVTRK